MLAITIDQIGTFMKKLLLSEDFDNFLTAEASITTFATFSIDGEIHPDFYDTEEANKIKENRQRLICWREIRPFCFSVFRGKRLPLSFHFVFQLPGRQAEQLLNQAGIPISPADLYGLYLNLNYRNGTLSLTSGTSLRVFTVDRALEHAWDDAILAFLKREGLN